MNIISKCKEKSCHHDRIFVKVIGNYFKSSSIALSKAVAGTAPDTIINLPVLLFTTTFPGVHLTPNLV
jgi:hypothetical protein